MRTSFALLTPLWVLGCGVWFIGHAGAELKAGKVLETLLRHLYATPLESI